jgi:ABC-type uncharacterized transport system permease subunit
MCAQEVQEKAKSRKKARKKTGLILLVVGVVLFGISMIMSASDITGLILGLVGIGSLVCLIIGLIKLIAGFVGKD